MSDKTVFTTSHEWVAINGNLATIGITQYAQRELGEIVSVVLPKVGAWVEAGKEACVLESTKAAIDIYAPLSGRVVAVNERLQTEPGLMNRVPESTGWLFQLEEFDPSVVENLLTLAQYKAYIEQ